jgi:hypothetical protein
MRIIACLPEKSAFIVALNKKEYLDEIEPLLAILTNQHTHDELNLYVSSKEEVNKDHTVYLSSLHDPNFGLRLRLRQYYDIEANDYEYFFLVNRCLTFCFSLSWDYPALQVWGDHSPFFASDPLMIESLLELTTAPMQYQGKTLSELPLKAPNSLEKEEGYAKMVEEIKAQKKRGVDDEYILSGLLGMYQKNLIDDGLYRALNVYLGYDVGEEWNTSSLPKRKVMLPPKLGSNSWDNEKHYSLEEAKALVKQYRDEKLSDVFIRNMAISDYLKMAIDYESMKLIAHVVKLDLDPSLDSMDNHARCMALEAIIY